MTSLEEIISQPNCIISIVGEHAGEDMNAILNRKKADITRIGMTFWIVNSIKSRPLHVQNVCNSGPAYVLFIEAATKGSARPTTQEDQAIEYSSDGISWNYFHKELSPVTGKLNKQSTALVLDMLEINIVGEVDLWNYSDALENDKPLKFILGCSTVCTIRTDQRPHPNRMKSRFRKLIALARLVEPYGAWVR